MAGKTKRMSTIKQLLRLHLQGVSNRKIADQIGIYMYKTEASGPLISAIPGH